MNKAGIRGFTLIELLIAIAVLVILITIATSAYQRFIHGNRVRAEIHTFADDLQFARSVAIKHGQSVTVLASGSAWHDGWTVFLDDGADGAFDLADDELFRVHGAFGNGDSMTGTANVQTTITFNRFGMFANPGDGVGTVTLHTPDDNVGLRRCIVLSTTGMLQLDSGGNCP